MWVGTCRGCAGVCCEYELDAERACCAAGVDACGVCGGDGSGCFGRAALALFVAAPADTTCAAAAFAYAGSWCAAVRADFCGALRQSFAAAHTAAAWPLELECDVAEVDVAETGRRRLMQVEEEEQAAVGLALEVVLQGPRGLFTGRALALLAATAVPRALPSHVKLRQQLACSLLRWPNYARTCSPVSL